ncbi:hypothetical protein IFM12275_19270 [Nocardia sputorum]|nr:hypothetical protein IFM12275_19270 [Nocardia sputorum]
MHPERTARPAWRIDSHGDYIFAAGPNTGIPVPAPRQRAPILLPQWPTGPAEPTRAGAADYHPAYPSLPAGPSDLPAGVIGP